MVAGDMKPKRRALTPAERRERRETDRVEGASSRAVKGLVWGIVGLALFFGLFLVPSIVAIVYGVKALQGFNLGARKGRGMAIAGIVLGIIGIGGFFVYASANSEYG